MSSQTRHEDSTPVSTSMPNDCWIGRCPPGRVGGDWSTRYSRHPSLSSDAWSTFQIGFGRHRITYRTSLPCARPYHGDPRTRDRRFPGTCCHIASCSGELVTAGLWDRLEPRCSRRSEGRDGGAAGAPNARRSPHSAIFPAIALTSLSRSRPSFRSSVSRYPAARARLWPTLRARCSCSIVASTSTPSSPNNSSIVRRVSRSDRQSRNTDSTR